jgi:hypothetical protein
MEEIHTKIIVLGLLKLNTKLEDTLNWGLWGGLLNKNVSKKYFQNECLAVLLINSQKITVLIVEHQNGTKLYLPVIYANISAQ